MAENTVSDQVWKHLMEKMGSSVISFLPNEAGWVLEEYKREMVQLGYCPYCEGKLDDENHPNGICKFKERDEGLETAL